MILSNKDVEGLLKRGVIKITPAPKPEQMGPGSVDLTLGNEFWVYKNSVKGKAFELDKVDLETFTKKVVTDKITLEPGELILGKTVEKLTLPNNIAGHLEGRSRYARRGLAIHVTSSYIQPGSDNHQVLEIVNLAPYSIILKAGTRCTQVIFEDVKTPTTKPYRKVGKISVRQ